MLSPLKIFKHYFTLIYCCVLKSYIISLVKLAEILKFEGRINV